MNVKEAVAAALEANREWMTSHSGIVDFILSECEITNVGNDEYDNIILSNPEAARSAAAEADAAPGRDRQFRIDLSLAIPEKVWAAVYGGEPSPEAVREYLENALFIDTCHLQVSVNSVTDENE